jgi:DNA-binding winged helix-turn-helix (wHTH) protein
MDERFTRAAATARVDLAHERDFALGPIAIRPSRREMAGEGFREILEPRVMRVLVALARANGEIVSRDDLTESCWDGVIVGDDAIKRCISQLRKAAEASGNAFAIETISRVGFRLKSAEPRSKFSICVLPFANMSGDPEQEYFSDGITDDVITDLSKVSALNVVSRNTAFIWRTGLRCSGTIPESSSRQPTRRRKQSSIMPDTVIDDIIDSTTVKDYDAIYFLGPFARRVSFTSQQHRSLNLVWALKERDKLANGEHVAVIGGGLAGLTTAAALIASGCSVTLFEHSAMVLERQRNTTHRFIHPTINFWPFDPLNPTTAYPFLEWYANQCQAAIRKLETEWKNRIVRHLSAQRVRTKVIGFKTREPPIKLKIKQFVTKRRAYETSVYKHSFDAVIVTTGFGDELEIKKFRSSSYWDADNHKASDPREFVVGGVGDGGLIEALRFTHKDFDGGELVVRIAEQTPSAAAEQGLAFERRYRRDVAVAFSHHQLWSDNHRFNSALILSRHTSS